MKLQPNPTLCELTTVLVDSLPTSSNVPIGTFERWIAPISFGLGQYYYRMTKTKKVNLPFEIEGHYVTGTKVTFREWADKWFSLCSRFNLYFVYDDDFIKDIDPKIMDILLASPNLYIHTDRFIQLLEMFSVSSDYNLSTNYSLVDTIEDFQIEINALKYYSGEFIKVTFHDTITKNTSDMCFNRHVYLNGNKTLYNTILFNAIKLSKLRPTQTIRKPVVSKGISKLVHQLNLL